MGQHHPEADHIGITVPLLKPPQSPHCYLGVVDHVKNKFPPTPGHTGSPVLSRLWGHSNPIVLKPFDLAQVCHGNKICSKLALTWKVKVELAFPSHCISNLKLNGISRTNISKVTLHAARASGARCHPHHQHSPFLCLLLTPSAWTINFR